MPESITPTPEEKKTIKNEYDFRRELLTALEEDFSSNNEVKDTEIYRQHILHALGQEFDQDDIKQTNNFRAKVVDGVKELLNGGGGGGGDFSTAEVTIHATYGSVGIASQTQLCTYSSLDGLYYIYDMNNDGLMDGETYTVLLHQGETSVVLSAQIENVTTSGNVTAVASGSRATRFTISGNCTITIS